MACLHHALSTPARTAGGPGPGDLARAFGAGLLNLRYQPQVALLTGAITGVDATLHWDDPTWDDVPAARTLALASEAGLDRMLSEWMLHEACRQMQRWLARGVLVPRVSLQPPWPLLNEARSTERILDVLDDHHLAANALALDIPLEAIQTPTRWVRSNLHALRVQGVLIALSGYEGESPSLRALSDLPVDELMIGPSLVPPPDAPVDPVAGAVIGIAQALGWRSVAVGMTHEGQLDRLRLLGCDEFRGAVICEPLPANILGDVVAAMPVQERIVLTAPAESPDPPTGPSRPTRPSAHAAACA